MFVIKTSILSSDVDTVYQNLKKTKLLFHVAKPYIFFRPVNAATLPEVWDDGKYRVKMRVFGFIPFGEQWIVTTFDEENKHIRDNGFSKLVKKWDHHIYLKRIDEKRTLYTDAVEIKAGLLTLVIWIFAVFFYRHRQRRWKRLIASGFDF